jgi:hypothetical protein
VTDFKYVISPTISFLRNEIPTPITSLNVTLLLFTGVTLKMYEERIREVRPHRFTFNEVVGVGGITSSM